MNIYLVRHGESQANVDVTLYQRMPDHAIPLSEKGRAQAEAAGRYLLAMLPRGEHVRLWCSPYLRARQTAACIREVAGDTITDVREHINLVEQNFGLFDGIRDAELPLRYPQEHAHYKRCEDFEGRFWARMPLGESRFDVAVRIHQAFGTFHRDAERHGVRTIVVVCHGVTLRAFVMQWLHLPVEWFEREPNPVNCAIRLVQDGVDRGTVFAPSR